MGTRNRIVICGGGAIGASLAYFLARRGTEVVVVERHEVGGAASGKSGGFLALDWNRGTALDRLARRSFDLHAELAETLGNPWGYRRLTTYGGYVTENKGEAGPLAWLSGRVELTGQIGTTRTTALVEPHAYTTGMMRAAGTFGARLVRGTVIDLLRHANGAAKGVALDGGETVEGDAVVIAMGPWSILASRWLPMPAVYGLKGHSLVFKGTQPLTEALFLEYQEPGGEVLTPELFPRADGSVWVCAVSSNDALPVDPGDVRPDDGAHERLEAVCRAVSPALAATPIIARQACFRPVAEDGLPLIGAIRDVPGAYLATGHSVWGMLNAPATGEALAELILDGTSQQVNLQPFSPARLRPLDPKRLPKI